MKKNLNINKTIFTLLCMNIIVVAIISSVIAVEAQADRSRSAFSELFFLLLLIAAVLFNSFINIRDARIISHFDLQHKMLRDSFSQLEDLNRILRSQRHDFMNHLQVIYSLMEMKDYKDATDYIEKIYQDIQKVNQCMKTSNAAINALIQAKFIAAEQKGVQASLSVTSSLSSLSVPAWEMCRILGNLMDNALDALAGFSGERLLSLEISENLKFYNFIVKNSGTPIPSGQLSRIFEPGYTTKGDPGHGMGLAITKELVDKYGGSIHAVHEHGITAFEVHLPFGENQETEKTTFQTG